MWFKDKDSYKKIKAQCCETYGMSGLPFTTKEIYSNEIHVQVDKN